MSERHTIRVWDLAVRGFHWGLAALVAIAFWTSGDDETTSLHVKVGLAILGLLVFRVVWGFIGSPAARFRAFVRGPRALLAYARGYVAGRPTPHLSHNPLGGVMVLLLLGLLGAISLTGILIQLGPEWGGPLSPWVGRSLAHGLREVHEEAAELLPVLIVLHVLGVLVSSFLERQNLVASMITGRKRVSEGASPAPSWPRRALRFGVAALAGGAVAIGVAWILPAGEAEAAETPASMLASYRVEAQREDPAFGNFDAARGEALYFREHTLEEKTRTCADCHTADPRGRGRSPAGKRIDPLAPGANPRRFTDRDESDKWFGRNCKQVLGRPCTAREKGDLLTWLMAL